MDEHEQSETYPKQSVKAIRWVCDEIDVFNPGVKRNSEGLRERIQK